MEDEFCQECGDLLTFDETGICEDCLLDFAKTAINNSDLGAKVFDRDA